MTYTTAHGNAGSLTHWARPGIKPPTSRFLVGFVSPAPQQELPGPAALKSTTWGTENPGREQRALGLGSSCSLGSVPDWPQQPPTVRAKWEVLPTPGDPRATCGGLAEEGTQRQEQETLSLQPAGPLLPSRSPPAPQPPALETHMMYSSLFSSVTRMLSPPSFSSCVVTLPRISMSWMKYSSRPHSSRLFSLGARQTQGEEVCHRRGLPPIRLSRTCRAHGTRGSAGGLEPTSGGRGHLLSCPAGRLEATQPLTQRGAREGHALDPDDGVVEFGVDGLQVFQGWSLVQHPLVEREGEARIDELSMVQSLRKEATGRGGVLFPGCPISKPGSCSPPS